MRLQSIPLEQILPNPDQPRKEFDQQEYYNILYVANKLAEPAKDYSPKEFTDE